MNNADYALIVLVGLSALLGLWRGLVREALAIAAWLLALWGAVAFGQVAASFLGGRIGDPVLRLWAGRLLVLVVVLLAGSLVGWIVGRLVRSSPASGFDRFLGLLFGVGRGVLVAGIFVLALSLAGFDAEPWWRQSKLIPYAALAGNAVRELAEERIADPPDPAGPGPAREGGPPADRKL